MKRVALVGAGSLGTLIGALITRGGREIELFDRSQATVEALNTRGARLGGFLNETIPVTARLPEQAEGKPGSTD